MFKNKLYLYGLGTGLVIASVLMQLMNYTNTEADSNPKSEPSLSETAADWDTLFMGNLDLIKEAAQRNGYQVLPHQDTNDNSADQDSATIQENNNTPVETDSEVDNASSIENDSKEILFTIISGMGSNEVAEELYAHKLIDNIDEFKEYLNANQLNTRIQVGSYRFVGSPEMEEIIKKITKS